MTSGPSRWTPPLWFYRNGMGLNLDPRSLLLEHAEPRSQSPLHVLLDVLERPEPERFVVAPPSAEQASGTGRTPAQWVASCALSPHARVWCGRHQGARALLRVMTVAESRTWLAARPERQGLDDATQLVEVELVAREGSPDRAHRVAPAGGEEPALGTAYGPAQRISSVS